MIQNSLYDLESDEYTIFPAKTFFNSTTAIFEYWRSSAAYENAKGSICAEKYILQLIHNIPRTNVPNGKE